MLTRRSPTIALVTVLVAVFGFLPIVNWIPGGHQAPWYATMVSGWINGSAIVLGSGLVLAIFSRRVDILWRDRALDRLVDLWREWPYRVSLVVVLIALALYLGRSVANRTGNASNQWRSALTYPATSDTPEPRDF